MHIIGRDKVDPYKLGLNDKLALSQQRHAQQSGEVLPPLYTLKTSLNALSPFCTLKMSLTEYIKKSRVSYSIIVSIYTYCKVFLHFIDDCIVLEVLKKYNGINFAYKAPEKPKNNACMKILLLGSNRLTACYPWRAPVMAIPQITLPLCFSLAMDLLGKLSWQTLKIQIFSLPKPISNGSIFYTHLMNINIKILQTGM